MPIKYTLATVLSLLLSFPLWGQFKVIPPKQADPSRPATIHMQRKAPIGPATPRTTTASEAMPQPIRFAPVTADKPPFLLYKDEEQSTPIAIRGSLSASSYGKGIRLEQQAELYLEQVKESMQIQAPTEEFVLYRSQSSTNRQHLRYKQTYKGLPVYGGEIVLHAENNRIDLLNGRYFPSPKIDQIAPSLQAVKAEQMVLAELPDFVQIPEKQQAFIAHEQVRSQLLIYHVDNDPTKEVLAYKVDVIPHLAERYTYFVDAHNGEVLHRYSHICRLHAPHTHEEEAAPQKILGKTTAQATDLSGARRTIDVYECQGDYYMIDANRNMFSGDEFDCTNGDRLINGVVLTLNAFDRSPQNDNFNYEIFGSSNNQWSDRTAVSAHYNGGQAYEYFLNTFGRNSINGQKGNIISFVHVADENGDDMDNAFWNGAAMFYGDGRTFFSEPLAKSLDVAAHEMAHGVIQTTANLVYENQPGALNESFADIFGAMVDRDDWLIGEEVVNPARYPSGAMRSMSDPNNGGNSSNYYWQPKHMNEYRNLPNTPQGDNGGVHINSGIPNHAFYLFATNPSVGRERAEQVYYDALNNYLVRSSQFVDLRISVVEAAKARHGAGSAVVRAAEAAFDAVGIGGGTRTDEQEELETNPGNDFVLWSTTQKDQIKNALTTGQDDGTFATIDHISKPSVSDDGSVIVFVDGQKSLYEMGVNWTNKTVSYISPIEESLNWRNVAISKDGNRLAAVTGDLANGVFDNEVFVYDYVSETGVWFELYNPTFTQGVSTGDVIFADALEWDHSGRYLLYDAANRISNNSGETIEYWDIGFVEVWDNDRNDFGPGTVSKLFSGLPENVSVGNPSFAKNSPALIVFDQLESGSFSDSYSVRTANVESGDQGLVFEGNSLGYPNFSKEDDQVIFHFVNNGQDIVAIRGMSSNQLDGEGDATVFIEDAAWGVWFATGRRVLTNTEEVSDVNQQLRLFPNPADDQVNLRFGEAPKGVYQLTLYDWQGRLLWQSTASGTDALIPTANLPSGAFVLQIQTQKERISRKLIIR
ncbi:MAG: M4 family metallopeptidase [Bacteroidota bacterium]